jgi:hypothetical protein
MAGTLLTFAGLGVLALLGARDRAWLAAVGICRILAFMPLGTSR